MRALCELIRFEDEHIRNNRASLWTKSREQENNNCADMNDEKNSLPKVSLRWWERFYWNRNDVSSFEEANFLSLFYVYWDHFSYKSETQIIWLRVGFCFTVISRRIRDKKKRLTVTVNCSTSSFRCATSNSITIWFSIYFDITFEIKANPYSHNISFGASCVNRK